MWTIPLAPTLATSATWLSLAAASPTPATPSQPPSFVGPVPTPIQVVVVKEPDKQWLSVDGLVALATLAAVVVALGVGLAGVFPIEVRERVGLRPELKARFSRRPPDAIRTMTGVRDQVTGAVLDWFPTYYFRLRIWNEGRVRAENVQVMLLKLQRHDPNGRQFVDEDDSTLPLDLTWSSVGGTTAPSINPGVFRHCDLCHTEQRWPDVPLDQSRWPLLFKLNTQVMPNPVGQDNVPPTMKRPGRYRLTIVISADNAKPYYQDITIDFSGKWSNDQVTMLHREMVVEVQQSSMTSKMLAQSNV